VPETLRPRPGLLARLGLGTPALRAWALYDCANSAAVTSILTAIFPIYFVSVVAADLPAALATERYAVATTASLVLVAVLSPFVGAIADVRPVKKRMLAAFMALGVFASASLFFVGRGDSLLGMALLVLVNVGLNGSFVFYDALLPHVAARTSSTASRPPGTRSVTWGAASSWRSSSSSSSILDSWGSQRARAQRRRRRRSPPGSHSSPPRSGGRHSPFLSSAACPSPGSPPMRTVAGRLRFAPR